MATASDPFSSFQQRSSSVFSFYSSLLQTTDVVVSLALCLQVMSQAPQHFKSFKQVRQKERIRERNKENETNRKKEKNGGGGGMKPIFLRNTL